MADADVNQQGTADLQGLCEFSWSSLKHVEVMSWGSFTFCKSTVFSERQLFCCLELCNTNAKSQFDQTQKASMKPMHRGVFGALFQHLTKH
jgi:hypothetical protein